MNAQNFFVTTPLYYLNDVPHIGHAYTSIAADVYARFKRLEGHKVFYLTGTDEHGQKVEKAAQQSQQLLKEYVNHVSQHFKNLFPIIDATPDTFIRTTEARHIDAAQALWKKLEEKEHIYASTYAGWYAVRDEAFYSENELIQGKAPSGAEVEWVEEPSYFFRLSAWQKPLLKFYQDNPSFIAPASRRNEVIKFVEGGLHDLSISRSTSKWGIPVPGNPDHVMYVWLDALTGYITALGYPDEFSQAPSSQFWHHSLHMVGKDILRFHAVYWPAFLMAADLPPPRKIFAHGWWTKSGEKMSKSLKNALDPLDLIKTYGSDQVRYFLMREVPFGQDGDFSLPNFIGRINSDLANDFGNLSQRVLTFIQKNAEGKIPPCGLLMDEDKNLLKASQDIYKKLQTYVDEQAFSKMCEVIWKVVREANRYIDAQEPWALRKTNPERMQTVLYVLAEVLRCVGILASPFIPKAASKLLDQLGIPFDQRHFKALEIYPTVSGQDLPVPDALFPRFQKEI